MATYADDAGTTSFGYDALNRLISADHPGADDFTYEYDPAGNITELVGPDGTSTREYSNGDRLVAPNQYT